MLCINKRLYGADGTHNAYRADHPYRADGTHNTYRADYPYGAHNAR